MSMEILVVLWIIYPIIEYTWSGMSKFLGIVLFSGKLVHASAHYLMREILLIFLGMIGGSVFFYFSTFLILVYTILMGI